MRQRVLFFSVSSEPGELFEALEIPRIRDLVSFGYEVRVVLLMNWRCWLRKPRWYKPILADLKQAANGGLLIAPRIPTTLLLPLNLWALLVGLLFWRDK